MKTATVPKLKEARLLNGKTIRDAAKDLGISKSQLHNYEKGISKFDVDLLVRIKSYYNVSDQFLNPKKAELTFGKIQWCYGGNL